MASKDFMALFSNKWYSLVWTAFGLDVDVLQGTVFLFILIFVLLFGLVWKKMEYVLPFFLFNITYYFFLFPTTKKLFWSVGHFLGRWMLTDDMYICSRALPVQTSCEGWGCSKAIWLKIIEIEMEKAIRSCSSHTHPPEQYRFPMVRFWCFPEGVTAGQCSLCLQHPASLPPPWKIRKTFWIWWWTRCKMSRIFITARDLMLMVIESRRNVFKSNKGSSRISCKEVEWALQNDLLPVCV